MSIQPTTRAGYRESARPHSWRQRIPYEHPGVSGERKFTTSRSPIRMAGDTSALALTPYSIGAPQGVGYAGQPEDSKFQTFSDTPQAHPEDWGPMSGYF